MWEQHLSMIPVERRKISNTFHKEIISVLTDSQKWTQKTLINLDIQTLTEPFPEYKRIYRVWRLPFQYNLLYDSIQMYIIDDNLLFMKRTELMFVCWAQCATNPVWTTNKKSRLFPIPPVSRLIHNSCICQRPPPVVSLVSWAFVVSDFRLSTETASTSTTSNLFTFISAALVHADEPHVHFSGSRCTPSPASWTPVQLQFWIHCLIDTSPTVRLLLSGMSVVGDLKPALDCVTIHTSSPVLFSTLSICEHTVGRHSWRSQKHLINQQVYDEWPDCHESNTSWYRWTWTVRGDGK